MYDLQCLIKRNIKNFYRDRVAVFFSLLSVLILLGIYFLFIGKQFTSGEAFEGMDGNLKTFLSIGVIMGGVLVINTVSLSLGVMGNIVTDLEQRKLEGFLVTPVKRYKIVLSYYISSIFVTTIFTLIMFALTILILGLTSGYWYNLETITVASLLIVLFTFISSTMMIFLTTLLKTLNAFAALSGVLGTFIGFLCGIYMPLSIFSKGMIYIASVIPFTHMTILLKQVLLKQPLAELSAPLSAGLSEAYGADEIGVLGASIPIWGLMLASALIAVLLLFFAYRNLNKKMVK